MPRTVEPTGDALAIHREGFARSLARRLTGKTDPYVVQTLYDWEVQAAAHGGTSRDPFNFRHGHDYKSRHDALVGSAHMLRSARFQTITKDLQGGFALQAHNDLGRMGIHIPDEKLPVALDTFGDPKPKQGNWADKVPAPIADAAQAIHDGSVPSLTSIFGGLSSGVVLVVLAVVLVVLLKK